MHQKLKQFFDLLNQSEVVTVDDGPYLHSWETDFQDEGIEPHEDEEVARFSWESDGCDYSSIHTISNIIQGNFIEDDCKWVLDDNQGELTVIRFYKLQKTNMKSVVQVKNWDLYNDKTLSPGEEHYNSHMIEVNDKREAQGQMYVDFLKIDNPNEIIFSVTAEINTSPLIKDMHVPCAHIHFGGDELAVSLFKIGDRVLIRPETDVKLVSVQEKFRGDGPIETFYWIE